MPEFYDDKYSENELFWGVRPSAMCYKVLQILPPGKTTRLLDIGCGEGRNSIFFARNGYSVEAFDLSSEGVRKTQEWAERLNIDVNVYQADLNQVQLREPYDVVFSTGTFQYVPKGLREELVGNYKSFTRTRGIHALTVPIVKPFIAAGPDADDKEHEWLSGEIFTLYADWRIEFCAEEIIDYQFDGATYQLAVNRIVAQKIFEP